MITTSTLIIGANRGIGLGLVVEALKVQPNSIVYATARNLESATALQTLQKEHGDKLVLLQVDMLNETSIDKAVATLKSHTSTLELMIVNAGQALGGGPITSLSSTDFLQNLNVNVVGPHLILKAFSPFLLASKNEKRTIGLMSSIVASINDINKVNQIIKDLFKIEFNPLAGILLLSKTALNMLGRQWAEILEPQGVAVSLIHPGAVATDMNPGSGAIPVSESATGIFKVLGELSISDTNKGILSYDGATYPW